MSTSAPEQGTWGGPIGHCPACGSDRMLSVTNGFETNFLCRGCGACWHVSLGRASHVDPSTCPSCAHAGECRGRLVVDVTGPAEPADAI